MVMNSLFPFQECSRFEKTIKSKEEEIQQLKEAIEFRDNFLAVRSLWYMYKIVYKILRQCAFSHDKTCL